ncbi:hypothetical protein ACFPM0_27345 [Pseudonocardia sulfidoxydans]|uniref:hypothetical protein n=1 Tax=Pseudonocardia sulfidoxydans TaxID=54011 RepID=UPI0036094DB8
MKVRGVGRRCAVSVGAVDRFRAWRARRARAATGPRAARCATSERGRCRGTWRRTVGAVCTTCAATTNSARGAHHVRSAREFSGPHLSGRLSSDGGNRALRAKHARQVGGAGGPGGCGARSVGSHGSRPAPRP